MPRSRSIRASVDRLGAVGFVVAFVALSTLGLLALRLPPVTPLLWRAKVFTATAVAFVVSRLGQTASSHGNVIELSGRQVEIIDECTGVYASILLVSFILAFPHPIRRKLKAIALAFVFVNVLNLVRLVTLCVLLERAPEAADFAHDYLWQVVWAALLVWFAIVFARRLPMTEPPATDQGRG
jgi:exosortase/archaeosortase family protein